MMLLPTAAAAAACRASDPLAAVATQIKIQVGPTQGLITLVHFSAQLERFAMG